MLVLGIQKQHVDRVLLSFPVVDHAYTSPLALPRYAPSKFSETTAASDDSALLGTKENGGLQGALLIVP